MAHTAKIKLKAHKDRSHSIISPSGATRWMNCTPSAVLEAEYGVDEPSVYAAEGTLAHEIAELYLSHDVLHSLDKTQFRLALSKKTEHKLFASEMLNHVAVYTDYCTNQFTEAKKNDSQAALMIEQRLDMSAFIPDCYGTADCIIMSNGTMEIIDLKYGKGIEVSAEHNKQLMIYALGAFVKFDMMYDIKNVRLTIVQPRIDNISSWEVSAAKLTDWGILELQPKAKQALAGEGEFCVGAWCRFCKVRERCKKLAEHNMELARHEFADPALLTDEDVSNIVLRTPLLVEWANSVCDYARRLSVDTGKVWKGLKLVAGVSRRKWIDEESAGDVIMQRFPELSQDEVFTMKLNSITAIEKKVGAKRFASELSDLTIKPDGTPVLVDENDKRPAIGLSQAIQDFQ